MTTSKDILVPEKRSKSGRIKELDGLRAISVVAVIAAHLIGVARIINTPSYLYPELAILGASGVQVFFVISGFIITRLQLAEIDSTGTTSIVQFYIKRFFRIIPAYWVYLAVISLLWLAGGISMKATCLLRSFIFISDFKFYPNPENWFCGHSWSLSVEEQFYLAFSFLMVGLSGKRWRWILMLLVVCYFGSVCCDRISWITHLKPLGYLAPFKFIIAGVLMAICWDRVAPHLKRLPAAIPFMFIAYIFLRPGLYQVHVLDVLLVKPVEALVVAMLVGWVIQNPGACGFLRWRFFQWLGATSYSFYLWQQLFSGPRELYGKVVLSTPLVAQILLILAAVASFYCIERPCIRLGRSICAKLEPRREAMNRHESIYVS